MIQCVICASVKHYSHKQRRHGVFACETCAKFFSGFMRNRQAYYCSNTGLSRCSSLACLSDSPSLWLQVTAASTK